MKTIEIDDETYEMLVELKEVAGDETEGLDTLIKVLYVSFVKVVANNQKMQVLKGDTKKYVN